MGKSYFGRPGHLIAVGVGMVVLDLFFVGLRFWSRRRQMQKWQIDDWLLVPATLLVAAMSAVVIWGVQRRAIGYGLDIPDNITVEEFIMLATDQTADSSKVDYAFLALMCPAMGLIKASFLLFYKRLFSPEPRSLTNRMLNGSIAFIILWTLGFLFTHLFECGTVFEAIWGDAMLYFKYCIDIPYLLFAYCLTDLVTDVAILLFPVPLIWNLNLTTGRKLATIAVFCLGGVTVAASATRLYMTVEATDLTFGGSSSNSGGGGGGGSEEDLNKISDGLTKMKEEGDSATLTIALHLYWALVETGVGIFAACLPAIPFLMRPMSKLFAGEFREAYRSIFSSVATGESSQGTSRSKMMSAKTDTNRDSTKNRRESNSSNQSEATYVAPEVDLEKNDPKNDPDGKSDYSNNRLSYANYPEALRRDTSESTRVNGNPKNAQSYNTMRSMLSSTSSGSTRVESEEYLNPPPGSHMLKGTSNFRGIQ